MAETETVERFTTPPFVLSYPHVFKASKIKGAAANAEAKFSCQAIWTPKNFGERDKKLWAKMIAKVCAELKREFKVTGANRKELQAAVREKYENAKFALRDGKARADKKGYGEGTIFASLTTTSPPGVVDLAGDTISPAEGNESEIYPGCICRATITIKAYTHESGGRGYSFYLGNLQKVKDGTRLDNRVAAKDDFDEELDEAWIDEGGGDEGGDEADNFEGDE